MKRSILFSRYLGYVQKVAVVGDDLQSLPLNKRICNSEIAQKALLWLASFNFCYLATRSYIGYCADENGEDGFVRVVLKRITDPQLRGVDYKSTPATPINIELYPE